MRMAEGSRVQRWVQHQGWHHHQDTHTSLAQPEHTALAQDKVPVWSRLPAGKVLLCFAYKSKTCSRHSLLQQAQVGEGRELPDPAGLRSRS